VSECPLFMPAAQHYDSELRYRPILVINRERHQYRHRSGTFERSFCSSNRCSI